MLWWFGHPVVYLLLFPAVAIYYLLVPRYAKRPLVAGNIIAVGWTIAVIANVTVWAHHLYMDYPDGIQAAINTGMEPLTFALTIVSALCLYSLLLTIYRSRWTWNAGSTALFLGLVSWLLAGLSGVVNATIAWDSFVHNTLWIVGHFHHMALLNIGIVIFGAIYAFLPDLLGRPLYSDRMGMWHVWLTFFAATAFSVIWIIQGLDGAPRRFAVLPGQYDQLTDASIPLVVVLAARPAALRLEHRPDPARQDQRADPADHARRGQAAAHQPGLQGFVMVVTLLALVRPRRRRLGDRHAQPGRGHGGLPAARRAGLRAAVDRRWQRQPAAGPAGVRGLGLRRLPHPGRPRGHRHRRPQPRPGQAHQGAGRGPGHQRPGRDAGLRRAAHPGPDRGRGRVRLRIGGK